MTLERNLNLPAIDGARADALLTHINVDRWDRGRPAELLRLVAYLSDYPQWTPIRRSDIQAYLERSPSEAHYDHRVMIRLASERVLQRTSRAGGDLWRVNPDLRHWRGVPGIPSWRAVVALFLHPLSQKAARAAVNRAGQSAGPPVTSQGLETGESSGLSVANDHPLAHNYHPLAHRPGIIRAELPADGAPGERPSPYLSLIPSSSLEEPKEEEVEKLVQTIREATGKGWIRGKQRAAVEQLCRDFPDHIAELIALAPVLIAREKVQWPSMAAVVLRERAAAGRWELEQSPEDSGAELARRKRLEELPRLIATWEAAGAEPEAIARLRSELEDLGGI